MSETTQTPSKFSIVNKLVALLKLGDWGKIENFITKVEKVLTKEIATLNRNASNEKFNSENRKSELKEKLEDAQGDLENAYLAIDPKQVDNNEKAKAFIDTYLGNIKVHQDRVQELEDNIKDEAVNLKDALKVISENIAKREDIIEAVTGK